MLERLDSLQKRYEQLNRLMSQPEVVADYQRWQELAQEQASLEDVVARYRQYKATLKSIEDARSLLNDARDEELAALAKDELERLNEERDALEREIKVALLPKDPADEKSVIMEIRAGAGGEEAGLFAADLFRMYHRYASAKSWDVDMLSSNETGIGGFKEVIFEVKGKGAYSKLKYESGVHRVQRVPVTEAGGRIHTSTATVAVLPEAEEVEVDINPEDLRMDIFHSRGAGGQNVNKVATAVRITHLPTGMVVTCQDERSQLRNKTKALAVLRARLREQERQRQQQEVSEARRGQVGSGERAEKIRTYNFPQGRVTDHRSDLTVYNLEAVLDGNLDQFIEAAAISEQARLLEEKVG